MKTYCVLQPEAVQSIIRHLLRSKDPNSVESGKLLKEEVKGFEEAVLSIDGPDEEEWGLE